MKPSVFVHSWTPDDVLAELGRHYDVDYANMFELGILPEEEIVARAAGKDGLVILLAPVPRAVFEDNAGTLKVCASVSVGTDNIDVAAATEAGVLVTNTAGVLDDAVADMAMGLLLAIGRRANVDGLDLEAAGIESSPRGITVDASLRTSNRRIFAIGDVVGPYPFTHMASYQAGIVIRRALFRLPAKVDYRAVPWVTYTDPELAHVGLTEAEALDQDASVRVLTSSFAENDRAQA